MNEHGRLIATLGAVALVLGAMVLLVHMGQKLDAMASLGFGVVLGNLTSAFSPSFADRSRVSPTQVTNAPNATTVTNDQANTAEVKPPQDK